MCFKVDFCSNDDKSVQNILLCFSANIQMVLFFKSVGPVQAKVLFDM